MKNFRTFVVYSLLFSLGMAVFSESAFARKRGTRGAFAGGSFSIGAGIALATAEQTGMNNMINQAKASAASTAGSMGAATEFVGYATFRFANGFTAIQLRPTLFSQSASGSGSDGAHEYNLDGYTIFPLARIIPLSNDFIDFYLQGGLGYGKLNGKARNGARQAEFSGSAFGMQAGLGAEFCFVPDHCFNLEGNYRYLPIERNIVSTFTTPSPHGTSQPTTDSELEDMNGHDIPTSLSGLSGLISYTYNF